MKRNLFLDLDGTVLDSQAGIVNCVNHALESLGRPTQLAEDLVCMIGPPLSHGFPAFLGTDDPDRIALAVSTYRERYDEIGIFESRLFAGIPETLAQFREWGCRLFLVTAKPKPYAVRILEHFEIATRFQDVYAPDFGDERDGKVHLVRQLLNEQQLEPQESIMVGDRDRDMLAGRENKIATCGALWGYGSRDELEASGAGALAATPEDLLPLIRSD